MKYILILLICLLQYSNSIAATTSRSKLIRKSGNIKKPTKPSKIAYIDFEYSDGVLFFIFPESINEGHVRIYENNTLICEEVIFYDNPTIDIVLSDREYYIIIETNNYGSFEGFITITN